MSEELYADFAGECFRDWTIFVEMPGGQVYGFRLPLREACPGDAPIDTPLGL